MKVTREQLKEMIIETIEPTPRVVPDTQIFCDMDGVLVNFEVAVVSLINHYLEVGEDSPLAQTSKSYSKKLRRIVRDLGPEWRAQSRPDLDIKAVRDFMMTVIGSNPGPIFENMPPWPDALSSLWPFLVSTGHIVNVLTAPIRGRPDAETTTEQGKEAWIVKWLNPIKPPNSVIMSPARYKSEYAVIDGVPNILVDDKASTVDAWNIRAPGFGILHIPGKSDQTIDQLLALGL